MDNGSTIGRRRDGSSKLNVRLRITIDSFPLHKRLRALPVKFFITNDERTVNHSVACIDPALVKVAGFGPHQSSHHVLFNDLIFCVFVSGEYIGKYSEFCHALCVVKFPISQGCELHTWWRNPLHDQVCFQFACLRGVPQHFVQKSRDIFVKEIITTTLFLGLHHEVVRLFYCFLNHGLYFFICFKILKAVKTFK